MTDHGTDEIRDLLARAMSECPEPCTWVDVEQRVRQHDAPPPQRRTGVWVAAAACVVALIAGLAAVVVYDDEPNVPIDDPASTTPSTVASTSVPAPTTTPPEAETGWTGGLLGDIDVESLRPLDSFNSFEGDDVIVPTAPSEWRIEDVGGRREDPLLYPEVPAWFVDVSENPPDNRAGQRIYLRMSQIPICIGCTPSGESATINGLAWDSIVLERIPEADDEFVDAKVLRARVDNDAWLSLVVAAPPLLNGPLFENPLIIEFIEGLRVGSQAEILASED